MNRFGALAMVLLLSACGVPEADPDDDGLDATPGAGAVEVRYAFGMSDVLKAAEEVLTEEEVTVERRRRNERRGVLAGRQLNGHRIKVLIRTFSAGSADAAVTAEPGNRELAGFVQGRIGEKLSLQKARADLFGERSVESAHAADLKRCVEAAEMACRALDLEIVHKKLEESGALLEARDASGRAVRIRLKPGADPDHQTGSVLTTDGSAEGEESELLSKVRREFERQLFPVAD